MNCFTKLLQLYNFELLYYVFFKMLSAFHHRLDIFKIMSDAQVFFVWVQNLQFPNYAEVNVKRLAFCLKISFQSKTGLCLQIADVSTTSGYFNICATVYSTDG